MTLIEYYAWFCDTYNTTVLYPVTAFKKIDYVSYEEAKELVGCNRDTPTAGLCPLGFGLDTTGTLVRLDDGKEKKIDRFEEVCCDID